MRTSKLLIRRTVAYAVDVALLFAVLAPAGWLMQRALGFVPENGPEIWLVLLVNFSGPAWLYFTIADASPGGATLGKRWLGIHVTRQDGARLSGLRAIGRTAAKLVPWELTHASVFALAADLGTMSLVQGVGLVTANALMVVYLACAALTRGRRSVHDYFAGTIVEPT